MLTTDAAAVAERPEVLLEECFGPVSLLVRYSSPEELHAALRAVPGSLTATLHSEPGDEVDEDSLAAAVPRGSGAVRGVADRCRGDLVARRGGPRPATTSLHTSVGASAIRRFLRPVAYQSAPSALLPEVLRDEALATLPHRRNGVLVLP